MPQGCRPSPGVQTLTVNHMLAQHHGDDSNPAEVFLAGCRMLHAAHSVPAAYPIRPAYCSPALKHVQLHASPNMVVACIASGSPITLAHPWPAVTLSWPCCILHMHHCLLKCFMNYAICNKLYTISPCAGHSGLVLCRSVRQRPAVTLLGPVGSDPGQ